MTPLEKARKQADEDLRAVMRMDWGRRFIWRHLTRAGLQSASFTAQASTTDFNEGRRDVAIQLHDELKRVCPDLLVLMLSEDIARATADAHAVKPSVDDVDPLDAP